MLFVLDQAQLNVYRVRYYHLEFDNEFKVWHMIAFDDTSERLVDLGVYNFYRQAIDVFAHMDYKENDLMYFKPQNKFFEMPPNITDERECISIYGSTY